MPVWEKKCPKCGRPIDLDTESSKMYCSYCNTQFWTDEFFHERTKYHTKNTKTKSGASFSSFFKTSSGKSTKTKKDPLTESFELFKLLGSLFVLIIVAPVLFAKMLNQKVKHLGTIVVCAIIAAILIFSIVSTLPTEPDWCGTYYPNEVTTEQNEKNFDFKATTSCEITEDTYVLTLNINSPTIMQRHFSGTYTENNGVLTFDTQNLYMTDKKIYLILDLQKDGYGIITIEYILQK